MAVNLFTKRSMTTAGAVFLSMGTIATATSAVEAATLNYNISGTVTNGSGFGAVVGDPISGSFSYDSNATPFTSANGFNFVSLQNLSFTVSSASWTLSDDTSGSGFPAAIFSSGTLEGVDFLGLNSDISLLSTSVYNSLNQPGNYSATDSSSGNQVAGTYTFTPQVTTPVPEPSGTAGMLAFGAGGTALLLKRKLKKSS